MNQREIKKIFEKKIGEKPISIIDKSKGVDEIVKIVRTKENIYVLKFPKYGDYREPFLREIKGLEAFKKIIPVPKILVKSRDYVIQEYLGEEDLDDSQLTLQELRRLYVSFGKITKRMHSIKVKGFGPIKKNGKPKFHKLEDFIEKDWMKEFEQLEKSKLFSSKQINKIKQYLEDNKNYARTKESYLLHLDLDAYNVRIKEGQIVGIIDFGDLFAGPRIMDLARIYISNYYNGLFDYFIRGYGRVDVQELKYFSVWNLSWRIPHYKKVGKTKKLEHTMNVLKDIIGINR